MESAPGRSLSNNFGREKNCIPIFFSNPDLVKNDEGNKTPAVDNTKLLLIKFLLFILMLIKEWMTKLLHSHLAPVRRIFANLFPPTFVFLADNQINMFVNAIEEVGKFTRPVYTISRLYNE